MELNLFLLLLKLCIFDCFKTILQAKIALDKFHRKDKRNRKQFYQLSHLEVDDSIC